jgi:hypothetical protein
LLQQLGGPALLRVPGRDQGRVRVASTLLHGNEPSGLRAIHRWLQAGATPRVDTLFWIGNVAAALLHPAGKHRSLPGGRDWNRIWLPPYDGPEGALAQRVLALLHKEPVEALIDLHNNTGHNPAYGVATGADAARLHLAGLFGRHFVCSHLRLGALVEATSEAFPSVTIECGRAGDPAADELAYTGLCRYLALEEIETRRPPQTAMDVLVDPVRVSLRPGLEICFDGQPRPGVDLSIDPELDRHNFSLVPAGTHIGWLGEPGTWPLSALDDTGRDRSRDWFRAHDGVLETTRPVIPIMMTTDHDVALSDCLFYIVRRLEPSD